MLRKHNRVDSNPSHYPIDFTPRQVRGLTTRTVTFLNLLSFKVWQTFGRLKLKSIELF